MYIILIDSGTTNTRMRLLEKSRKKILDIEKIQVGVRNTAIDGDNEKLKSHLQEGIKRLLLRNQLDTTEISYIVASGMITSNLGIYEVPHVIGPAQIEDFASQSKVVKMEDFFDITWVFTPGLKNNIESDAHEILDRINEFDIMRGEEVETIGLLEQFQLKGRGVVVLPGSHTKFIFINEEKGLESCLSTLGGETLFAIQKGTILADSLPDGLVKTADDKSLIKGFEAAEKYGLTRSFYHIRLLQMFSSLTENEIANYYVGAVLYDDLKSLEHTMNENEIKWAIIGGSSPLRNAFTQLIKRKYAAWHVMEAADEQMERALIIGPQKIAANIKGFQNEQMEE